MEKHIFKGQFYQVAFYHKSECAFFMNSTKVLKSGLKKRNLRKIPLKRSAKCEPWKKFVKDLTAETEEAMLSRSLLLSLLVFLVGNCSEAKKNYSLISMKNNKTE